MDTTHVQYQLIRVAAEKGLEDIKASIGRGTRNLLELGDRFARGIHQKAFFRAALQHLENEKSPYYAIVEHVVRSVDSKLLTTFGMNLGYNSWTKGANQIREIEQSNGYNVPWTLCFRLEDHRHLSMSTIDRLLKQANDIGIYTFMFHLGAQYTELPALAALAQRWPQCAFVCFVKADVLTPADMCAIRGAKNICTVLDVGESDAAALEHAVYALKHAKMLYAGFCSYPNDRSANEFLHTAEDMDMPVLFYIKKGHPLKTDDLDIGPIRENPPYSVFPIDFYQDIAFVDRNISSEGCVAIVESDGEMCINNMDLKTERHDNILKHMSLSAVFQTLLPKKTFA